MTTRICCCLVGAWTVGAATAAEPGESVRTYVECADAVANPGQGWSATVGSYARLEKFLSVGDIYERFNWKDLEPQDGVYDWRPIDRIADFAEKKGIPFSFRIMCANSGASGPVTPAWVWEKGAKFHEYESISYGGGEYGKAGKTFLARSPVFEDETFVSLHRRFIAKLAERYDGDPRLAGIDLGSYGNWGEWHCGKLPPQAPERLTEAQKKAGYFDSSRFRGRKAERLGFADMKKYVDIYLDNFKASDVVFMTDGVEALEYAIGAGEGSRVGLRRDGVGGIGHFRRWIGSPPYDKIVRMGDVWKSKPVWFEFIISCRTLIRDRVSLPYTFDWMLTNRVSLVNSFPADPGYIADKPEYAPLLQRVNCRAGARLVPVRAKTVRRANEVELELAGVNRGVSKIYLDYVLTLTARDAAGKVLFERDLAASPRSWLPGPFAVRERVPLAAALPEGAVLSLRIRSRRGRLRDFRFAVEGLTADGSLPL